MTQASAKVLVLGHFILMRLPCVEAKGPGLPIAIPRGFSQREFTILRLNIQMDNDETVYINRTLTHNLCSHQPRKRNHNLW